MASCSTIAPVRARGPVTVCTTKVVHVIVGAWAVGATKETRARTACGWNLIMLSHGWHVVSENVYGGPVDVMEVAQAPPSGRRLCSRCARTKLGRMRADIEARCAALGIEGES